MIRVITAHELEVFRAGLNSILGRTGDIEIVAKASTQRETQTFVSTLRPDVLVAGLPSAGCASVKLLGPLMHEHPGLRVLIVTAHTGSKDVRLALSANGDAYLTGECSSAQLIDAVRKIARGGKHLSEHFAEGLLAKWFGEPESMGHEALTARELEVFLRIAEGKICTKIASELSRSVKTISSHKARIMGKMHLQSTAQLVQYAVVNKLLATKYRLSRLPTTLFPHLLLCRRVRLEIVLANL